jgi:hypothetical protein
MMLERQNGNPHATHLAFRALPARLAILALAIAIDQVLLIRA